jgi:hypothetical protein
MTDLPPHTRWLATFSDRCNGCGMHVETQGCACNGTLKFALAAKAQGQAVALAAHPTERSRIEAAIRQLAATGKPFSANDARAIHGATGGVVGATFSALKSEGVIRAVGDETSSKGSTHGHRIFQWIGAA